ncbi:hypothetical protein [Salinirubrum litoreum]|uniref:Uncharacterized protein n=1 Tax=Salinirubrum litoreum TaxID=1126234 RepID=A0ABD5RG19_9EURY|nr:hypothetical protein [Salinirubrum litoreum]
MSPGLDGLVADAMSALPDTDVLSAPISVSERVEVVYELDPRVTP